VGGTGQVFIPSIIYQQKSPLEGLKATTKKKKKKNRPKTKTKKPRQFLQKKKKKKKKKLHHARGIPQPRPELPPRRVRHLLQRRVVARARDLRKAHMASVIPARHHN
jgi:hypothetical protein